MHGFMAFASPPSPLKASQLQWWKSGAWYASCETISDRVPRGTTQALETMNPLDTAPPPATPSVATPARPEPPLKTVVRQQVHDASSAIKDGAAEALDTAKETATHLLAEQKGKLADLVSSYGKSLSAAGDRLAEEDGNSLVQPARKAARQLEDAAVYLREKSGTEMMHDLGRVARSKPEWFFGGLFVAGLAAARFLKASAPERVPGPVRSSDRNRMTPMATPISTPTSSSIPHPSSDES